jgi:hypothetical protein
MWDLWWTKWYWDRVFSESFGFTLSISLRRCSICPHISSGGWTKGLLAAQFHRDIVSPHRNNYNNGRNHCTDNYLLYTKGTNDSGYDSRWSMVYGRGSIPGRGRIFLFAITPRPALRPTRPTIWWILGALAQQLVHEADPFSTQFKNAKSFTSTPPVHPRWRCIKAYDQCYPCISKWRKVLYSFTADCRNLRQVTL